MATHSSVLAWRIPGTAEPGGLPSMGVTQSQTQLKQLSSSSSSMLYMKVKRGNPKSFHYKEKYMFFSISLILCLFEMKDVH